MTEPTIKQILFTAEGIRDIPMETAYDRLKEIERLAGEPSEFSHLRFVPVAPMCAQELCHSIQQCAPRAAQAQRAEQHEPYDHAEHVAMRRDQRLLDRDTRHFFGI